jgi:cold shock protein
VNNRDRDFRPNRRRSFDDDNYEPPRRNFGFAPPRGPQFETPSGSSVRATVEWYNPEKGFGFVQLTDGSGDAFLHVSVAERSGHGSVPPGATVEVRTSPGPKGPQVTEIISVDATPASQVAASTSATGTTGISVGRPRRRRRVGHGEMVQHQ